MMTFMNFLSFPAIDFDFIWSWHMTWVTPTTAQPKQPLATRLQLLANAIFAKKCGVNLCNFHTVDPLCTQCGKTRNSLPRKFFPFS